MLELDAFASRGPRVSFGSRIDDDAVVAHGEEDEIVADLSRAAADLQDIFVRRLNVCLAEDKAVTFASSQRLATRLSRRLRVSCPSVAAGAAVSPGSDLAPRPRRGSG